ncbi:MAG: hypothetical protein WAP52_01800 [Candidatus Sungiibacteriota bacterium]
MGKEVSRSPFVFLRKNTDDSLKHGNKMRSSVKQFLLAAAAVAAGISALWVWRGAVLLIAAGSFQNYGVFIAPAGLIVLAACLFSLVALFVESARPAYIVTAAVPATTFFLMPQTLPVSLAIAAAMLIILLATQRIRSEYALSIGFSVSKTLKAGLPIYFTALSLVITLFYYQQIAERERPAENIIPRGAVDLSLRVLSGAVSDLRGIPPTNSLMTVDEFLAQNLESQLKMQGISSRAITQKEIAQLIAEQRNELAKRYGIQMKGGERLADVLHRTITGKVEELLGPYARFLPFLSALAFFLALRTFAFPLYFIVVGFTALLIVLLRAATIIKSEKRSIEVERLTL